MNRLHYGDNLEVLREHVGDGSVDLVYLDPPFNSNVSYNILFRSPAGAGTDASIEAFDDSWTWGPAASAALIDITRSGNHRMHALMQAMRTAIGENAMMAYLAMMAVRLIELHRVLKPTGSLYLHCDPTASHYLKLVLDAVFGAENFRNEIIWKRSNPKSLVSINFPTCTDTILRYAKSAQAIFHPLFEAHDPDYVAKAYRHRDRLGAYRLLPLLNPSDDRPNLTYEFLGVTRVWRWTRARMQAAYDDGLVVQTKPGSVPQYKKYLGDSKGRTVTNCWTDIPQAAGSESLGYPTQKPIALLERIIAASSNPDDVVLDPFCGCGTAVDAAQKLGRRWIGIDVTHLAVGLIEKRLREGYGDAVRFETIGVPKDSASARRLAAEKPHEFQNWFCLKVGGYPLDGGRKGADKGVDGHFYPYESAAATSTGVISVKAGQNVGVAMLRDLRGVMEREGFPFGLFLSASDPTRPMRAEAATAGLHDTQFGAFPRMQILTPGDLFHGRGARLPPLAPINRRAARVDLRASHQPGAQASLL